jgi:hypothetical protein
LHLTPLELTRLEEMMERGNVHSNPATLSNTDSMLDAMMARAALKTARRDKAAPPRAQPKGRPSRADAAQDHAVDWTNLPSLEELLDIRRSLLRSKSTVGEDWR